MLTQILALSVFFVLAIGAMGLGLKFAKYKRGNSACCGGGHCSSGIDNHDGTRSCSKNKEVPTF